MAIREVHMENSDMNREETICRTRMIVEDLFECLENPIRPQACGYSFLFGASYFCRHPDRQKFSVTFDARQK